jgi:hypothetical protein
MASARIWSVAARFVVRFFVACFFTCSSVAPSLRAPLDTEQGS